MPTEVITNLKMMVKMPIIFLIQVLIYYENSPSVFTAKIRFLNKKKVKKPKRSRKTAGAALKWVKFVERTTPPLEL